MAPVHADCARGSLCDVLQQAKASPQRAAQLDWLRRIHSERGRREGGNEEGSKGGGREGGARGGAILASILLLIKPIKEGERADEGMKGGARLPMLGRLPSCSTLCSASCCAEPCRPRSARSACCACCAALQWRSMPPRGCTTSSESSPLPLFCPPVSFVFPLLYQSQLRWWLQRVQVHIGAASSKSCLVGCSRLRMVS